MIIKIGKNKIIFPDSIIVLLTSILLIFCYEYAGLIFKNSKDGFLNAKATYDSNNCRLKEKNDECIKNLIQSSTRKKYFISWQFSVRCYK